MSIPGLPSTASLIEEVDKRLLVILRDGKKMYGILRAYDQFGNIVLDNTIQRIFVGEEYAELPVGLFFVRGENVAMLGEIDSMKDEIPTNYTKISYEEIVAAQERQKESSSAWKMLE